MNDNRSCAETFIFEPGPVQFRPHENESRATMKQAVPFVLLVNFIRY